MAEVFLIVVVTLKFIFLTFFYMKENNIIDRLHLETLQIIDMIWI